jgi:hypothetical protein
MSYGQRSQTSPHPMFGINIPGYSVGDLPSSYNSGILALTQVSSDTTSSAISHGGNGVELNAQFGDGATSCSIDVAYSVGGAIIHTFTGITKLNSEGLFIGYADDGVLLGGAPITVRAYNFVGGGKVTIKVRRTS